MMRRTSDAMTNDPKYHPLAMLADAKNAQGLLDALDGLEQDDRIAVLTAFFASLRVDGNPETAIKAAWAAGQD